MSQVILSLQLSFAVIPSCTIPVHQQPQKDGRVRHPGLDEDALRGRRRRIIVTLNVKYLSDFNLTAWLTRIIS